MIIDLFLVSLAMVESFPLQSLCSSKVLTTIYIRQFCFVGQNSVLLAKDELSTALYFMPVILRLEMYAV